MDHFKSKIRGKFSLRSKRARDLTQERGRSSKSNTSSASASLTTTPSESSKPLATTTANFTLSDPSDCTDYLWARAYSLVEEREHELIDEYKHQLADPGRDTATKADISSRQSVESLVKQLLDNREKKQWRISLLEKDITLRRQVERLTKFLLWSDPIVKSAVSTQPYAALAWSGVSVFLALLSSATTQNDAMLKGFNAIGDLQIYWQICEDRPCSWSGTFEQINKQDKVCRDIIGPIEEKRTREITEKQLQQMQESQAILDDIREILKEGGNQARKFYEDEAERALLRDLASAFTDSSGNAELSWNQESGLESYKNINPERVPGTCEWFYGDERFRKWRAAHTSSFGRR
ncbi:hypothetical protein KXX16_006114 [Aspergillus fumigatus]|nr:hypothetical protein KXX16_006114 [Aspergillus fumigatus]KAH1664253.1 hypothetical protein KXX46_005599 [Aspergillus fumigatus]KAH1721495.1 hypothetical protein KXX25_002113 [Aspergillus fumigatus]KAH1807367.1 hypothetical protein KXX35_008817 [Aspergillus fumigatus]KAH2166475.1 hypothetical protein KXW37_005428 [Aspergillus fumigatus]